MSKLRIYLASPYTHSSKEVMEKRERDVCRCALELKDRGEVHVYCPIAETSALARHSELLTTTWEDWRNSDLDMLSRCDELWICQLDGWESSRGIKGEVKYAMSHNILIRVVDPRTCIPLHISMGGLLHLFGATTVEELND